jgi:hypothetical protein
MKNVKEFLKDASVYGVGIISIMVVFSEIFQWFVVV